MKALIGVDLAHAEWFNFRCVARLDISHTRLAVLGLPVFWLLLALSARLVAAPDTGTPLTFIRGEVRGESPFDVSGVVVHNCRLVNFNQQFIKGSSIETDPVGATDGCIEQCLFEFTSGWAYQSYTGGIDIHKGVSRVVRDNLRD